jgi:malate synthase
MGGMAAQIPIKNDEAANQAALAKVRADKQREATDGHDGTWVAHPGPGRNRARRAVRRGDAGPNQIDKLREDVKVTAAICSPCPRANHRGTACATTSASASSTSAAWLSGNGCVPLYNLMEDAATAEISRAQIWQWINHPDGKLEDGRKVTVELFREILGEEVDKIRKNVGDEAFESGNYALAAKQFDEIITNPELEEFLTLRAYEQLA